MAATDEFPAASVGNGVVTMSQKDTPDEFLSSTVGNEKNDASSPEEGASKAQDEDSPKPVRSVSGIKVCLHQSFLVVRLIITLAIQWFFAYLSVLSTVFLFALDGTIVSTATIRLRLGSLLTPK
jgi:hypothetical protein